MAITISSLHRVMTAIWGEISSREDFTGFNVPENISNVSVSIERISEITGFNEVRIKRKAALLEKLDFISILEDEKGTVYFIQYPRGFIAALGTAENLIDYLHQKY